MRIRRVDVGEVALEIAEAGEGGRPFLLVHGFTGAKEDFSPFLDDLAALGWHAVAPDLRGHGGSDRPSGEDAYGFERFAADLVRLADALGWGSFAVLGHSMGGMVVQHLVLAHGARVEVLVLMDTSSGTLDMDESLIALASEIVREQGMAALLDAQRELEGPLDTPAHMRLIAEQTGYAEFCDAKLLASAPDMWLSMVPKMFVQPDRTDDLRALRMPTLVIAGEQDKPFLGDVERIADAIPGAELVIVSDAGHSPQFENRDAWWRALTSFLDTA